MRRVALIAILILFLSLPLAVSIIGYSNVTVSAAKNMINSNPSLVVLDVRTQSEYDSGHIGNAKHIPVGELEGRLDELETADEILVYCRSGGRSATASQILADNGFSHVYNMLGGITAWIDAGYLVYVKYSSIQEAINSADGGDTIYVSSGTYYENVVVNKTVSLVGEDKEDTIIDGGGTGRVIFVQASNVTTSRFTVKNSGYDVYDAGVWLASSENEISDNYLSDNSWGIGIEYATSNMIRENSIVGSEHSYGSWGGGLILLEGSDGNTIINNVISCNEDNGIYLSGSYNNIVGNTISNHTFSGIHVGASDNFIYHNNFLEEGYAYQVWISDGTVNLWDNGCEGNFWSDYVGTDNDGDGIGETPYVIDENNTDHYPLMNPYWNPADINHDLKVDIYDIVLACSAYSSTPLDTHWNCHCDIAEPYGIIDIYDIVMICTSYGEEYSP